MKTASATILVLIAITFGCTRREPLPVIGPDYTYLSARLQIRGKPITIPMLTPYDGSEMLRNVFLSGFTNGWDTALAYWLGNAIDVPETFRHSPDTTKAWQDGCNAGQESLYKRVRSISTSAPRND